MNIIIDFVRLYTRETAQASAIVIGALAVSVLLSTRISSLARQTHPEMKDQIRRTKLAEIRTKLSTEQQVSIESDFPHGWWTSETNLDLEKRAIFAKKSVGLAHISMFSTPGSYLTIDHPAGYPILLVLGRDLMLRGFHNVCRHRAYPVVSVKKSGCTAILACRYHGWTYDFTGRLVKAPKFDHLDKFDKSANSLWEVNLGIDDDGVVFVNLGTGLEPKLSARLQENDKVLAKSWDIENDFNWKIAESSDAFTFPSIDRGRQASWWPFKLYGLTILVQICPRSAQKSNTKAFLFARKHAMPSALLIELIEKDILSSLSELENLHSAICDINPVQGIPQFDTLRELLKSHQTQERLLGTHIWPASERIQRSSDDSNPAERLRLELEAGVEKSQKSRGSGRESAVSW